MGVPKFFRWISERWPMCSQLIADESIPEFDNLYLDMNGIIHNCTHKDEMGPSHKIPEEKMFLAIFTYIEHLYGKIKPKKLFFMAVDGVAPRAKMNQQRGRRFRSAKDAEDARKKAAAKGEELPDDPFDSNCITPGTVFMAELSKQLRYFINKKVSEDKDWQGVEIVLSGHEVPGEGEHKIMEYLRHAKAQPDYDANIRHCIYGLDADLIMLGLLSHDPHFALLREEVTFGRTPKQKSKELESQNFFLLHLSILREYLELEFDHLESSLDFTYDFERIIDDFILLAFFVGNDFLPNLQYLHINEGALAYMFDIYKRVLPSCGGYVNEKGIINLDRLEIILIELEKMEYEIFEMESANQSWLKSKQTGIYDSTNKPPERKSPMVITPYQKGLVKDVKTFTLYSDDDDLDLPSTLNAADRQFVSDLATQLGLECRSVTEENGEKHLQLHFKDDFEPEDEGEEAMKRVFRKYDRAQVSEQTVEQAEAAMERKYHEKFDEWKDDYYKDKLHFSIRDEADVTAMAENYVQGLQWVLLYYYRGVPSWSWFYHYHYSPKITDIRKGLKVDMNFDLAQPFKPFEQLMGVLPSRSRQLLPEAFRDLMTEPSSSIIDFYPADFHLDLNGKKQDWEAIVKIPFIDEKRLLDAMKSKEPMLTAEERGRNSWGDALRFIYNPNLDLPYKSSMPEYFPDLIHCRCLMSIYELPSIEGLPYRVGLLEGAKVGIHALAGFPSLHTLPYRGHLEHAGVNVFQQASKNESMVITLQNGWEGKKTEDIAREKIGKKIFVGWPYLREGKVLAVSDNLFRYEYIAVGDGTKLAPISHGPAQLAQFERHSTGIEENYSKRWGVVTGEVEVLVHVAPLKGLRRTDEGAMVKDYAEGSVNLEVQHAIQTTVDKVHSEDVRYIEKEPLPVEEEFPVNSVAFFLGEFNYGRPLRVIGHQDNRLDIQILTLKVKESLDFAKEIVKKSDAEKPYFPSYTVATLVQLKPLPLSKITSSFSVVKDDTRLNLGLSLKFEARRQKVLGYSRRVPEGWQFSDKALALIKEYKTKFPEFINALDRNPHKDLYEPTDFYPANIANEKIDEIDKWIKSTEPRKLDRVSIEADQLDADTVKKIEEAVATLPSNLQDPYRPKRVNGVPRHALLHPTHAEGRLQGQAFACGDRVVYVQNSGKVDIAMRGTVVGINTNTLDVVFDQPIMSGSTLGGRTSENRGSIVPKSSVLNLTNPTVIAFSKAALQRKPDAPSEDNSRTASPAGHATRSQFNRPNGPPGRGRGGGGVGKWYTPWGINSPNPDLSTKPGPSPKQTSPFNPTVLLRASQPGAYTSQPPTIAHQYRNGVAIPPPASLDQRQRVRTGPPKPFPASTGDQSQSPRGGSANGFRGGRSGRGGFISRGGGAVNGSPVNTGSRGGAGGGRGGRGGGHGAAPPAASAG